MMSYNCDHRNHKFIPINHKEDKDYIIFECECHTTYWINKETRQIDKMIKDWSKVDQDSKIKNEYSHNR
jgi:hypothetical protein